VATWRRMWKLRLMTAFDFLDALNDFRRIMNDKYRPLRSAVLALLGGVCWISSASAAPFTVQGPGVNPADFRITIFATNLNFPVGMARLSDGSLLVGVSQGSSFWNNSTGQVVRLTDTN